jgi:hypothetical protein
MAASAADNAVNFITIFSALFSHPFHPQTKAPPNRKVRRGHAAEKDGRHTNQRGNSHGLSVHNSVSVCGTHAPNCGPIVHREKIRNGAILVNLFDW